MESCTAQLFVCFLDRKGPLDPPRRLSIDLGIGHALGRF